ncbi:MacB-like periplasmic core domain protein [uncultured archaeon]|nr:MacB-like periplasmic core domain protein [uncultured archaeon]
MKLEYFGIALKNLRRRGVRSWLTLLGIVIGITAVVALVSLGDGLKTAVNSQFQVSSTELITVQAGGLTGFGPPGSGVVKPLTKEDVLAIGKISSVEAAIGRNIETLKMEFNNKLNIGYAVSNPEGENGKRIYSYLDLSAAQGRLIGDGDNNKILIGNDMGDGTKNGFGKDIHVGDKISINGKDFRVAGILAKKGSFTIDRAVIIMEQPLRDLTNNTDEVDVIAVKVKSKDLMEIAKTEIEKLLRERRNVKMGQEDFQVSTPQAMLSNVNQILTGIQIFIALIASISILVGAVGIVNTMTTSVMERFKEIGIMKAIGAKNSDIFFQFFFEAGLLGLIGGVIGILLGLGIAFVGVDALNQFIGGNTPHQLSVFLVSFALFGSFFIGSVSGIAPALKAASLNPVEALRK